MTETAASAAPVRPGVPRWLWAAFIASLAVNCLVLGAVLRFAYVARHASAAPPGTNIFQYTETLPPDRRETLRQGLGVDRAQMRTLRQELRTARREAARELVADPFDKEKFAAAQAHVADLEARMRQEFQRVLPEMAARMSAAERRALLRWRDARVPRPARWGDQPDQGP